MKKSKLEMSRQVWEYFREYKKAPFKQKYQELQKMEEPIQIRYKL